MTTVLRPEGPERLAVDGGRDRDFAVIANGRRVGSVGLGCRPAGSLLVGELSRLEITEGKGRGRGAVAALAAEEVLRDWGCALARAVVPADAAAGLRLAASLGWVERARHQLLRLARRPRPLPAGLRVRPMTDAEFERWSAHDREMYAEQQHRIGLGLDEARAMAARDQAAALPEGRDTAGMLLRVLCAGEEDAAAVVGTLWLRTGRRAGLPNADPDRGWVMLVEVEEGHRGRGYGRALMRQAERECRDAGLRRLGLNVFVDNAPALALYDSLGYRTTSHHFVKRL